jgi:hypothetical protein
MDSYEEFLQGKMATVKPSGFMVEPGDINPKLFLFQSDIVRWALSLGKAAIFAECGLGKTPIQLEWGRHIAQRMDGKVLILAPLAVAGQTVREGEKFDIGVTPIRNQQEAENAETLVVITNYETFLKDKLNPDFYAGVVLDESSILKNYTGKTKQKILDEFRHIPYKLACTATPAPNDHLELGNHADFLDIMPSNEMISRWFINDSMQAGNYRLKRHAAADFWRWLTGWAVCLSRPGDLGPEYDMPEFELPELNIHEHVIAAPKATIERAQANGRLIPDTRPSATTMHKVKRESCEDRAREAMRIIGEQPNKPWVIWCDTNYEADALKRVLPKAVEVRGSHSLNAKEKDLLAFADGKISQIITKPKIAGLGLNWQKCANMVFVGVSYSFEAFYQAMRRTWRFGQEQSVNAHIIYSYAEGNIITTLNEKRKAFEEMQKEMNTAMNEHGLFREQKRLALTDAEIAGQHGEFWTMMLGDCVERTKDLTDNIIGLSIHSPPFANLYIYSDSVADMGNANDYDEFFTHYRFLIRELHRVTMPGRLAVVHCKDLPRYMNRDGAAGLYDFPGEIVRAFEGEGWQYHSRVTIWKDPVIEMQRTKNHGLLHKNFVQRGAACRQGMADYLVVFRKWTDDMNEYPEVEQYRHVGDYVGTEPPTATVPKKIPAWYKGTKIDYDYSVAVWQRYASPVWFDIDQTRVLNFRMARGNEDEKHICPLQLDVIARSIDLWSNEGDIVFSPFAGIGSEGYIALLFGRRFIGIELKREYFDWACKHLAEAQQKNNRRDIFDALAPIAEKRISSWWTDKSAKAAGERLYFNDQCAKHNIYDMDGSQFASLKAAIEALKERVDSEEELV